MRQLGRAAPVLLELVQVLQALQAANAGQGLAPLVLASLASIHPNGQVLHPMAITQLQLLGSELKWHAWQSSPGQEAWLAQPHVLICGRHACVTSILKDIR